MLSYALTRRGRTSPKVSLGGKSGRDEKKSLSSVQKRKGTCNARKKGGTFLIPVMQKEDYCDATKEKKEISTTTTREGGALWLIERGQSAGG